MQGKKHIIFPLNESPKAVAIAAVFLLTCILFEFSTPLGVAAGVIYVLFVLSAIWFIWPYTAFVFAAIATILTVKGYFFITEIQSDIWIVQLNRSLSVLVLWVVAFIVYYQRQTENKRQNAQEEISKAIGQLETSNTELERFAYVASHDLQEPLRMVVNFTELLKKEHGKDLNEEALEYVNFSTDAASRMQALVSDLLEYSRVGQEAEKFIDVDCMRALDSAKSNLAESIKQYGAKITNDALPTVKANPIRVTRLMQNLIGNGIKYTSSSTKPSIHVSVMDKKSEWLFSIKDNGIGMKEEYLERIFIPFKRLHTHDKYAGTGIGLAICKKIVENFGGRIWVESELGEGSTFYFTIPKIINKEN